MRILHIANFSLFMDEGAYFLPCHAMDRKISNGLIRNGHSVWNFSCRDAAFYLSSLKPWIAFGLPKPWRPPAPWSSWRRRKELGVARMNAYLGSLAKRFKPDLILLGHTELLAGETLAGFRKQMPSCKIAQWWVDLFPDDKLAHLRPKQPYLDAFFATTAPSYYRRRLAVQKSPPSYYLPNIVDASVETERAFAADQHEFDILFAGSLLPERQDMLIQIQKQPQIRGGFFGFGDNPKLGGHDLAKAIGRSKFGLNLSRMTDIPLYSSDRLAQLTGNGCLVLTPRSPEMTELYNENEVVYYDSREELAGLIKRYKDNDSEWRRIARAGWERAHRCYSEKRVARFIVEAALGGSFSEDYEWLKYSLLPAEQR